MFFHYFLANYKLKSINCYTKLQKKNYAHKIEGKNFEYQNSFYKLNENHNENYKFTLTNEKFYSLKNENELSYNDFNLEKQIGMGAFGKVFLVSSKTKIPNFYALKAIKKDFILYNDEIESVFHEREISVFENHNPYVIKLYACFQNNVNDYRIIKKITYSACHN